MEGLIPMVYRAIKKHKVRSHYECLSSGAAQTYNISDFHLTGSQTQARHLYLTPPPPHATTDATPREIRGGHRRSHSMAGDFSFGRRYELDDQDERRPRKQQLVRFRSTRVLSCLTGS